MALKVDLSDSIFFNNFSFILLSVLAVCLIIFIKMFLLRRFVKQDMLLKTIVIPVMYIGFTVTLYIAFLRFIVKGVTQLGPESIVLFFPLSVISSSIVFGVSLFFDYIVHRYLVEKDKIQQFKNMITMSNLIIYIILWVVFFIKPVMVYDNARFKAPRAPKHVIS